ncbi:hypothetical protein L1887_57236 [Cichorium endivia]|nr:hypothetical protein L1887_57236 [Cichorium endivia]
MDGREVMCVLVEAEAEAVGGLGGGPGIRRAQAGNHTITSECGTKPKFPAGSAHHSASFQKPCHGRIHSRTFASLFWAFKPEPRSSVWSRSAAGSLRKFSFVCGARERASERRAIPPLRELAGSAEIRASCVRGAVSAHRALLLCPSPLKTRDDVLDKSCVMQVRRNPTHTVMRLSRKGEQVVAEMRPDGTVRDSGNPRRRTYRSKPNQQPGAAD